MAISRARKEELVGQYMELLDQSQAVFLAEYAGLDVKQMEALRGDVRKVDGRLHVTKNTLLIYALEQQGKPVPSELLNSQIVTGFALGEVPALAKALVDFAKRQDDLVVKGAILGENILTLDQVKNLAELPSLDELRAQIIGLISAPARNIASTVASGVRQVVNVLDAYARSEGEAEAGTETAA